jgi:hypothetical protein
MSVWRLIFFFGIAPIGSIFSQSLPERPIAIRHSQAIQGIMTPQDSSSFTFTGARGGYIYKGPSFPSLYIDQLLYDKRINYIFDSTAWKTTSNTTQTFDANNRLISQTLQYYINNNWVNYSKDIHDYTTNHSQEDTVSSYLYDSLGWYGTTRTIHTFNSLGKIQTEEFPEWSGITRNWVNKERKVYLYDTLLQVLSVNDFTWDTTKWKLGGLDSFVFDAKGNKILSISYNWPPGFNSWQLLGREVDTFDSLNRILTQSSQSYDFQSGFYVESERFEYTYLPNNGGLQELRYLITSDSHGQHGQLKLIHQTFLLNDSSGREILDSAMNIDSAGKWVDFERIHTSYDTSGNILILTEEYANGGSWAGSMETVSYGAQNQVLNVKSYRINAGNSIFDQEDIIWYEEYSNVKASPKETFSSQVYPNPCTKTFSIEFTTKSHGETTLFLYDINGKLITRTFSNTFPGKNSIVWDIGHSLNPGCFNYVLIIDGKISTGKILFQ